MPRAIAATMSMGACDRSPRSLRRPRSTDWQNFTELVSDSRRTDRIRAALLRLLTAAYGTHTTRRHAAAKSITLGDAQKLPFADNFSGAIDVPVRERSHYLLRACRLSAAAVLRTAQAADQELRGHFARRARCPDRRGRRAGHLRSMAQRASGARAEAAFHSVGRCRHRSIRPCSAQAARHSPRERAGRQCQRRFRARDGAHSGAGPAAA